MKHEVNKDSDRPNPLNGHAVSHKGTVIGLSAILLWGFMAGLVRIVADNFGATLGSALIYTVGGMLLLVVRKLASISEYPRKYLLVGGVMFVLYEAFISLAIGLASTSVQSLEVSLVNYLWPTLLVLMTAAFSHKKGAVWRALPGAVIATIGVSLAVGGEDFDVNVALQNIVSNPLPYLMAFAGAFIWAIYATVTPSMSNGYDGTTVFFCCVAVTLWIIHFVSGQGLPVQAPSVWGFVAVFTCALSIAGGYACWGMACCTAIWRRLHWARMRADTIHRIRNGAAWRCTRCAILGWCDTRGGRLVDQCVDRQTCHQTHRLSVRFPRIGHLGEP